MNRRARRRHLLNCDGPAAGAQASPRSASSAEADDLDQQQIDQLHAATLQVSGNCFELKKLCATVLVAAGTLIATLSDRELDHALFVGGLVIVAVFWTADAQSYFIQAKLRSRMRDLQRVRVQRIAELGPYGVDGVGLPINVDSVKWRRVIHSFFNASMLYYLLIAVVVASAWVAYGTGLIE